MELKKRKEKKKKKMMARIFGFISIHNISLRQWKLNYFEISEERLSYSTKKLKKKKKKKASDTK
jgi:hypothetical protein